jgi:SAM-dependent methyltransferase
MTPSKWDIEYGRGGIPSSVRQGPSGVLLWVIDNWPHLTGINRPQDAIDIGCGTGRNSAYLASLGVSILGFDNSEMAIQTARDRFSNTESAQGTLRFLKHDLVSGLPTDDKSIDLAVDIFVYKHQIESEVRASYRRELRRILRQNGRLLLSLAGTDDGYYANCPRQEREGNPITVVDPVAGVASVLFSLEDLIKEFEDTFILEMSWHKSKEGPMHGSVYKRSTIATIWRLLP